ncbi:RING finger domain protein [Aspergillus sclerotioniger CBS 115572]|uniref:RING-type E3 ubiquitin transferase n=1 Tax=Aspergillus sclerotioniger CBS 115572 TaxID=1450535 RepID=A0A317XAH4_9EURO|nr:RING finger domain protein [Aspergillus sclerotioniger CBS 115572]PWY95584.1 RING finger domain protein [Aspergillus sclerotioniger CBS 115572]
MTAKSLTTVATLFADPSNTTAPLNESSVFSLKLESTIQTLSEQNAPDKGPIQGLLFVPRLDEQNRCNNATAPFIPANVTRLQGVTQFGSRMIGLAPWVNDECTQAFLNASQDPTPDALVFFLPSNDDTKPPSANDPVWLLGGSAAWQSRSEFPVYAIPGAAGVTLMDQLSRDGTTNQTALAQMQSGVSQLMAVIDIDSGGSKMPSIWGFILAILGTILVLTIILLLFYQLVHKRHQRELQRRLEAGEADLEQLAQHHVKVPPEFLETMPIYLFSGPNASDSGSQNEIAPFREPLADIIEEGEVEDAASQPPAFANQVADDEPEKATDDESARRPSQSDPEAAYARHQNRLSRLQTTCAICLDDFVPMSSRVRELPCGHIFHPPCIDTSLMQSSSLCPLCKKSVLPGGWLAYSGIDTTMHNDPYLQTAHA